MLGRIDCKVLGRKWEVKLFDGRKKEVVRLFSSVGAVWELPATADNTVQP